MRCARLFALLLALAGLLAVAVKPVVAQLGMFTIAVTALTVSNISGTAALTSQTSGTTRIDVQVASMSEQHPMHIHEGPCASANPTPWYALSDVRNGASGTDVHLTVADLTSAPKSILVHRSADDIDTVEACADISLPAIAAQAGGMPDGGGSGLAVLTAGGPADFPIRPAVAFALFAVGTLGLYVRRLGRRRVAA